MSKNQVVYMPIIISGCALVACGAPGRVPYCRIRGPDYDQRGAEDAWHTPFYSPSSARRDNCSSHIHD